MAIIKCKMCGGDLNLVEASNVAECEYCGSVQTVPTADNEKKMTLFGRANKLRLNCEFDKAAGVYESIVADFPEEAEAYWGLVLCRYGIEYVDDPSTGKKIPTCHRSSFDSVMDDSDFEQALENTDAAARKVYREEAKAIEKLRKDILEVSSKEDPYDIFICYKETDREGERTIDSVIAQEVYEELTSKGYRVFFSRISLEDKLGVEYEPYIFAALNSAKIMLAFGTDYEYYNAVWVKNEWSRFLALISSGQKKTLIPCYKDIDIEDMPKEFRRLQAQNMGKVGAMQDLLRGIEKISPLKSSSDPDKEKIKETVVVQSAIGPTTKSLVERANIELKNKNWKKARELFDQALSIEPQNAESYLGLAMADEEVSTRDALFKIYLYRTYKTYKYRNSGNFEDNKNYKLAKKFATGGLRELLDKWKRDKKEYWENTDKNLEERRKKIAPAAGMIILKDERIVALKSDGTVLAVGPDKYRQCQVSGWKNIIAIAASKDHTVGLRANGKVVAVGDDSHNECQVSGWENIIAISAGICHTVGLKKDGTVVAVGHNKYGQCNVSGWRNIIAILAVSWVTFGLKKDGTVVYAGYKNYMEKTKFDFSGWKHIVAITECYDEVFGLKADGSFCATDEEDGYSNYKKDISDWKHIVQISGGYALNSAGTVYRRYSTASRDSHLDDDEFDFKFSGIVSIFAYGSSNCIGLKTDGTVVVDDKKIKQSRFSKWTDIVAVALDSSFSDGDNFVGIRADGTVVTVGKEISKYDLSGWKLFDSIDTLEQYRADAIKNMRKNADEEDRVAAEKEAIKREREAAQRRAELESEKNNLTNELQHLGIFSGKRRKEINARLYAIEQELKTL